jgi:membrane-associated phospholipid phosphatase
MRLRKSLFLVLVSIIMSQLIFAQVDSAHTIKKYKMGAKSLLFPASLFVAGTLVKETAFREYFQNKIQNSGLKTHTKIDDYTKYVPVIEMYIADLCYKKTKGEVFQQTKNYLIARILNSLATSGLKGATQVTRPDGTERSFPSGHTSFAFTGATALFLEYKDDDKILAFSGFVFSTVTGFLRITNNRHWISDVIAGAGIGMLSSTLVWYTNPLKSWDPFKKKKISVYPSFSGLDKIGICLVF